MLERDFIILADAELAKSFSVDGVLVARASHYDGIDPVTLGKRSSVYTRTRLVERWFSDRQSGQEVLGKPRSPVRPPVA